MFKNKVDISKAISCLSSQEIVRAFHVHFKNRLFKIESGILYFDYSDRDDNLLASFDLLDQIEVVL